ncbi:hypothetical protein NQ176_g1785 [Zarea fungicola]|uniref:Uncharacterized protein n=1 Tax=Zarea fungicola TaxID=93591 RepID=A0ACC1NU14_9HYPO|nr:hypothetical protein NQ176_g1785 [Lecanicillium fungicola]
MKFSLVSGAVILSAGLATAAPIGIENRENNPGGFPFASLIAKISPQLADALQQVTATFFQGGDAILNTPIDAVDGVTSKNAAKGLTGTLANIPKTFMGLLSSLFKVFVPQQSRQPAS